MRVVVPLTLLDAAVIVLAPAPTPVASPVALIVAMAVFDEDHVAVFVRFCVELSLNNPVALN